MPPGGDEGKAPRRAGAVRMGADLAGPRGAARGPAGPATAEAVAGPGLVWEARDRWEGEGRSAHARQDEAPTRREGDGPRTPGRAKARRWARASLAEARAGEGRGGGRGPGRARPERQGPAERGEREPAQARKSETPPDGRGRSHRPRKNEDLPRGESPGPRRPRTVRPRRVREGCCPGPGGQGPSNVREPVRASREERDPPRWESPARPKPKRGLRNIGTKTGAKPPSPLVGG